ncbi:MAG: hypothetical protein JWO48_3038, partial [Bryobacterales bacterium]|nr:hypothetical protein [Bryobacterales bacterium]
MKGRRVLNMQKILATATLVAL